MRASAAIALSPIPGSPHPAPQPVERRASFDALCATFMRKILALALLALALAGGVAAGASMLSQPAHACGGGDC